MDWCDVLIVGGGPAGSTCAERLVRAGLDVVVLDRARFPRDKVCAGWITPAVIETIGLDLSDYGARHTLQPFRGFRTGPIDGPRRTTDFGATVSYGIRRCEFDAYLLRRTGARLREGEALSSLTRRGDRWIVNESIDAGMVVGAGGHFCPVARHVNQPGAARGRAEQVVVAQEIEFELRGADAKACPVAGERPELYFWPDLQGYGWCVRKGAFLNVGVGQVARGDFPATVRDFAALVDRLYVVPGGVPTPWKGHAYLVNRTSRREIVGDGVLLVGDAAGLALAPSGEGILTAVESGLMAAATILKMRGHYGRDRLAVYADWIEQRMGPRGRAGAFAHLPAWAVRRAARAVFQSSWLTRRVLIEDGFLHVRRTGVEPSVPAH